MYTSAPKINCRGAVGPADARTNEGRILNPILPDRFVSTSRPVLTEAQSTGFSVGEFGISPGLDQAGPQRS